MSCRSACSTQDHTSYGACLRAAAIQIDRHGLAGFRNLEKDKDNRLSAYESARRQGLRPVNTGWEGIRDAWENGGDKAPLLDVTGMA